MKRTIATLFALAGLAGGAEAADYASYETASACANTGVLTHITQRFDERALTYLKAPIAIAEIRHMSLNRLELRDATHPVEREYCQATALTSDGQHRTLWYLIERNWGFAGMGENVEFCLSGLDPWHVYGAHCKSLR
ncbi:hypothetical protein [Ensifer soli]|uniref:hypothetical protein n=1 Tax=Ciceribacter sp. sgz301302 TaxID=3342379 RepID=UPI0035BB2252